MAIFPCGQALANIISSSLNRKLLRLWGMHERFLDSCAFRSVCHGNCGEKLEVVGSGNHSLGWYCGSREQSWATGLSRGKPGLLLTAQHL